MLSDRVFAVADTLGTSRTLALAIEKEGADLVLCGRKTVDSETWQVPPEVAAFLGVPQLTNVARDRASGARCGSYAQTDSARRCTSCRPPGRRLRRPRRPTGAERQRRRPDRGLAPRPTSSTRSTRTTSASARPARRRACSPSATSRRSEQGSASRAPKRPRARRSTSCSRSGRPRRRAGRSPRTSRRSRARATTAGASVELVDGRPRRGLARADRPEPRAGGQARRARRRTADRPRARRARPRGGAARGRGRLPRGRSSARRVPAGAVDRGRSAGSSPSHLPRALLVPATGRGRDYGPRTAGELELGMTADCVGVDIAEGGAAAATETGLRRQHRVGDHGRDDSSARDGAPAHVRAARAAGLQCGGPSPRPRLAAGAEGEDRRATSWSSYDLDENDVVVGRRAGCRSRTGGLDRSHGCRRRGNTRGMRSGARPEERARWASSDGPLRHGSTSESESATTSSTGAAWSRRRVIVTIGDETPDEADVSVSGDAREILPTLLDSVASTA